MRFNHHRSWWRLCWMFATYCGVEPLCWFLMTLGVVIAYHMEIEMHLFEASLQLLITKWVVQQLHTRIWIMLRWRIANTRTTTAMFCRVPFPEWQSVDRTGICSVSSCGEWLLCLVILLKLLHCVTLPLLSLAVMAYTSHGCRQGRPLSLSYSLSRSPSLANGYCLLGSLQPAGTFLPCVDNQVCNLKLQEIQTNLSHPV